MSKPVEIEFLMRDRLSSGLHAAGKSAEALGDIADRVSKNLTDRIAAQREQIRYVERQLKSLQKQYDGMAPGPAQTALRAEIDACTLALREDELALAGLEKEHQKNAASSQRLTSELRQLLNAMARMRLEGKQNTQEYQAMAERAALLQDTIGDLRQQTKILSHDDAHLQGFISGVNGASGALTAATGILGVFAAENENLVKIQTRVQSVMAITMGLQQVMNTLNKDSAFRLTTVVKMKNLLTAANVRLATSLGISNAAASALMATLTLGLSAAVGFLITLWDKYSSSQAQARKQAEEFGNKVAEAVVKPIVSINTLSNAWSKLGDNLKAKEQFLVQHADKFNELNVSINNVADAERLLIENKERFIEAQMLKAKAVAATEMATEKYQELLQTGFKLENTPKTVTLHAIGAGGALYSKTVPNRKYQRLTERKEELETETAKLFEAAHGYTEAEQKILKEIGQSAGSIAEGSIAAIEKALTALRQKYKDATTDEDRKKYLAQIKEQESQLLKIDPTAKDKDASARKKREQNEQNLQQALVQLELNAQQSRIDAMRDGTGKMLAQIEADYQKRKASIQKQAAELAKLNKENGISELNENGLSVNQQQKIDEMLVQAETMRTRAAETAYRDEAQLMLDYLKEYGTFQQQKYAIAEEYNQKIAESTNAWQRKSLERQRDDAINQLEVAALKMNIDWNAVFGELGGMFRDMLRPALEDAKQYMQSDAFKQLDQSSQKDLVDAIHQMEETLGGSGNVNFKTLAADVRAYQDAQLELQNRIQQESEAYVSLEKAQSEFKQAVDNGTEAQRAAAEQLLNMAQQQAQTASEAVKEQQQAVRELQGQVSNTATSIKASMDNMLSGLQGLASGSLRGAYDGLINLSKSAAKTSGAFSKLVDSAESVPIVGLILSVLDILKDGVTDLITGLLDSIFSSISNILSDILSGDLFVGIFKSLRNGIGNILNTITFGGFSSLISAINGSNAKAVNKLTETLSQTNKYLEKSIEALKEQINQARGVQNSVKAYETAVAQQKQLTENKRQIAAAQMGYHDSHHSNNYYIDQALSSIDWGRITTAVGSTVRSASDLWKLSPEALNQIVAQLPDLWEKIGSAGRYGDKFSYVDEYLEQVNALDELLDSLRESLTQLSFDDVYGNFIDMLMNMDSSTEDFADNISEYFMRAMLSNMIGATYADQLKEWYNRFADSLRDDYTLDPGEMATLRDEYMQYVEQALKERDALADLTGYSQSQTAVTQSGKAGALTTMTQDQGIKLEGLMTSIQIHEASIDEKLDNVTEGLTDALDALNGIWENTHSLPLIYSAIQEIKRDGLKVK